MHVVAVFLENLVFIFFSDFALVLVLSFMRAVWQRFGCLPPVWHNLSPAACFISGPFCPFAIVGNKFSEVHVLFFLLPLLKHIKCLSNVVLKMQDAKSFWLLELRKMCFHWNDELSQMSVPRAWTKVEDSCFGWGPWDRTRGRAGSKAASSLLLEQLHFLGKLVLSAFKLS